MIAKKKIFLVSMFIVILLLGVTVVSASTNTTKITKDTNPTKVIKNTDNKVQKTVLTKEKNKITKNNTKKVTKTVKKEQNKTKTGVFESKTKEKTSTNLTKNTVKSIKMDYNLVNLNYYYDFEGLYYGDFPGLDVKINITRDLTADDMCEFPYGIHSKYKNVLIEGNNHTIKGIGEFLEIPNGVSLIIENVTITGCNSFSTRSGGVFYNNGELTIINSTFLNNKARESGGVIYNDNGNVTVSNSTFQENSAEYGGAISLTGGTVKVNNSTFYNNSAEIGGAIQINEGNVIVDNNSHFIENYLLSDNDMATGGAISAWDVNSELNVTNTSFIGNRGYSGSAIDSIMNTNVNHSLFENNTSILQGTILRMGTKGNFKIEDSVFKNNTSGKGSAVWSRGPMTILNTSFVNNTAENGTFYCYNGTVSLKNCTFENNSATNDGGGIYTNYQTESFVIEDTYFINNTATIAGAIYNNGTITVRNSNFTENKATLAGAFYNENGRFYLYGNVFYNNTPENFALTQQDDNTWIKLINKDGYLIDTGYEVDIYKNGIIDGASLILQDDLIQQYNVVGNGFTLTINITQAFSASNFENNAYFLEVPEQIEISAENITVEYGNTTFDIPVTFSKSLESGDVIIKIGDKTIGTVSITELTDNINVPVDIEGFEIGNYTLGIEYVSDGILKASNKSTLSITKMSTKIESKINDNTLNNVSLDVKVTDNRGNIIESGDVIVYDDENKIIGTGVIIDGKANIPLNITEKGNYNVNISYVGSKSYESSSKIETIDVLSKTNVKIEVLNNTQSNVTIDITVKDQNNNLVKQQEVKVTLPNGTVIDTKTDSNGKIQVIDKTVSVGERNITVEVLSANGYIGTTETEHFTVINNTTKPEETKTTQIIAEQDGYTPGENSIKITLNDETGNPIKDATVKILDSDKKIISTAKTDSNGNANVKLDTYDESYKVTVSYDGDKDYKASKTTLTVKTFKKTVTVKVDQVKGFIGENIKLVAHITDKEGNPVNGGNVVFKINGKTLRQDGKVDSNEKSWKISVKNGVAKVTIKADANLINMKIISAVYSGSKKYEGAYSDVAKVEIMKRSATLTVTAKPNKQKQYKTMTFTVKVKDTTKNHKNKTIIYDNTKIMFKINGKTLKDSKGKTVYAKVNKKGIATYKYKVPAGISVMTDDFNIRNYNLTAVFIGKNYKSNIKNSTKINFERSPVTINFKKVKVSNKNKVSITANIKDYMNKNVIGTNKIAIKFNGKTYKNPKTGKTQYFKVENGKIKLKNIIVNKTINIKKVTIVTGERQAYLKGQNQTTKIIKV